MAITNGLGQVKVRWRAYPTTPVTGNDTDAQAFLTATGITDSTLQSAVNTLVSDLKTYGLWTKMKAIYPFVGGSAAAHKFNLKDPRDLDVAYRLIFSGGGIHSSTGWQTNGSNSTADTRLNTKNVLLPNNLSIGFYTNTDRDVDTTPSKIAYGNSDNRTTYIPLTQFYLRTNNGNLISDLGDYNYGRITGTNTKTSGFYVNTRASNNSMKLFKNNTLFGSNTTNNPTNTLPNSNLFIASFNDGGSVRVSYETINYQFFYVSDGLTDTEASNFYISVQKFQTTLGRHVGTPYVSDTDAIAFLTAAGITDATQAAAINTLVITMKANGTWTKMKAIYPFVGGNATSHKFNLKDPRDLDAAFRLVFSGGWTHGPTGAKPNGTTGYADTKINAANTLTNFNTSLSTYLRTTSVGLYFDMGVYEPGTEKIMSIYANYLNPTSGLLGAEADTGSWNISRIRVSNSDSKGFYTIKRTSNNSLKLFKNGSLLGSNTTIDNNTLISKNILISAVEFSNTYQQFSNRETAFASIGDGLTDTEATNLYSAVQEFQTTLGRQVSIPKVSDTDAQAFLNAANITSFQQASAVNKLVIDLKAAGVWTKMKAIYPFVGGSAASHKFNLKDPRDLDAAFRLVFNGGWTHTSTGALPNGTNGYADTKLSPLSVLTSANHFSFYNNGSISNTQTTIDIGSGNGDPNAGELYLWTYREDGTMKYDNGSSITNRVSASTTSKGFSLGSRTSNISQKIYKNGNLLATNTNVNVNSLPYPSIYIGSGNINGTSQYPSNKQSAFVSIGDGLTDLESTALYTAVQTYQTALGRAVDTPVYNNGLVLNLDAGNANSYPGTGTTWFDLASGNNGTLVNGPTYDASNGGSIVFDGVNDHVITNDTSFRFGNKFSISIWFYWDGLNKTNNALFGKRMGSAGNYNQYGMGISNGDTQYGGTGKVLSFYARVDGSTGGNDPFDVSITYTLPTAGFYNACIVMDTNSQKLYVNGILVGSNSKNLSGKTYNISGRELILGASRGENATDLIGYASTKINRFSVYSYSLTDTEVLSNFNSTRGRFGL